MKNILIFALIVTTFNFSIKTAIAVKNITKPETPPIICYTDPELGRICVTRVRVIKKK